MDRHCRVMGEIDLITGHMRLLADLMLVGPDLQDSDRRAFARVLRELSARLERASAVLGEPGAN